MAAAAVAVVGTAISVYGQAQAASEEAKAANMQAALKEAQATEVLRRARIDDAQIRREGEQLLGDQKTAQAGMGGSVTSGNLIMAQADAQYNILSELIKNKDEATFNAAQIRAGAAIDRRLADNTKRAAWFQGGGTLLTSAYNYSRASGRAG